MTRCTLLILFRLGLPITDAFPASLGASSAFLDRTQRTTIRRGAFGGEGAPRSAGGTATAGVTTLPMGLYDQPLPPRPPPVPPNRQGRKGRDANYEDDDDDDDDMSTSSNDGRGAGSDAADAPAPINLFEFDAKGHEVNDLLPNLGRWLDKGVGCYYEATDRPVVSLVRRTSCSPMDACWALEACKGDVTEAWTRISVARRLKLEGGRLKQQPQRSGGTGSDDDGAGDNGSYQITDADVLELEMEEEFLETKQQRIEEKKRQDVNDMFRGGDKDQNWLPRQTKGPVDDEPWFTG